MSWVASFLVPGLSQVMQTTNTKSHQSLPSQKTLSNNSTANEESQVCCTAPESRKSNPLLSFKTSLIVPYPQPRTEIKLARLSKSPRWSQPPALDESGQYSKLISSNQSCGGRKPATHHTKTQPHRKKSPVKEDQTTSKGARKCPAPRASASESSPRPSSPRHTPPAPSCTS